MHCGAVIVILPRPVLQAVVICPGYNVPVGMKDHLPCGAEIVLKTVKTVGMRLCLHSGRHELKRAEQRLRLAGRHVQKSGIVPFGNNKRMSFGHRVDIEESQNMLVLIDPGARNYARNILAE